MAPNLPAPLSPTGKKLTALPEASHARVRVLCLAPAEFDFFLLVEKPDGSAFPTQIPRWMMPRPGTMSRLLDRTENGRLVRRAGNPNNEKAKRAAVTREGEVGSKMRPGGLPLCTLAIHHAKIAAWRSAALATGAESPQGVDQRRQLPLTRSRRVSPPETRRSARTEAAASLGKRQPPDRGCWPVSPPG
jgi:hypothetical protein